MTNPIIQQAEAYIKKEYVAFKVPYKKKAPAQKDWQNKTLDDIDPVSEFDGEPCNIGVLMGALSGGIVDIDLDSPEALALSDILLPKTEFEFGHASRPSSHKVYQVVDELPKTTKFCDVDGSTHVEIRSTGAQTIFPGSTHPNGEPIEFVKDGEPLKLPGSELNRKVALLASGSLLARHWPGAGSRHDLAMAVAGALGRSGYAQDEIEVVLFEVAKLAGDDEPEDRKDVVAYTLDKLSNGVPVTGLPTVAAILGDPVANRLRKWLGTIPGGELDAQIAELNRHNAVVMIGGNCRVLNEEIDPVTGQLDISFSSFADFKRRYSNCKVVVGEDTSGKPIRKLLAPAWLDHPKRRQYDRVVFAPGRELPGCYKLWRGFAVAANEGDCQLYLDHLHYNVCGADEALYDWLVGWMADVVQAPCNRPGTAVVLRGKQGVGKTIACATFGSLFGPHFGTVSQARHLAGNFNAHLQDCLLLLAEEAFWAGDKRAEGVLKDLITGHTINIERKGIDVQTVRNFMRLMVTSNHDWVVPAGLEERRFCVLDVSEAHMQDTAYFAAIVEQMENGGCEALLHFLLNYDYGDVDLRTVPQTMAL